jgi:hypothetical protein
MDRKLAPIGFTVAFLLAGCGSTTPTAPPPSPAASPEGQVDASAPSPTSVSSPSPISTTDWVPFTSDHYGYTVSFPPTHTGLAPSTLSAPTFVAQAQRDFAFATDQFEGMEIENGPLDLIVVGPDGSQIAFFGFAETIPAGSSVDDIIRQSVGGPTDACNSEPITIDGQPGRFDVCGDGLGIAIVIVGDRAYVFLNGRGSDARNLMLAFLSTVQLPKP